ncbi:ParA family protein [Streptosporangium sp. NPDC051022]|uniref:ParA family protein n=1 Tax=Streptosporangium sp. NPDC051022 TaxID=3155752 RepID=UPI003430E5E6
MVNQKGGVGKTASTINLGGALAARGHRVLLVDLDPQGHLSDALKLLDTATEGAALADVLLGKLDPARFGELPVTHSEADNGGILDVIPTTDEMFLVGPGMYQLKAREMRLKRFLAELADRYDYILIDCPPSLDVLTDNALTAADGVLIPVQLEDSTIRALRLLFAQIESVEADLRTDPLVIHGMVASMVDRGSGGLPRSNIGRSVLKALEGLGIPILATVPRGVSITEAWREGDTVATYAPDSEHATAYVEMAKVLEKGRS